MNNFKTNNSLQINYEATLTGEVNGNEILVKGEGTIIEGVTQGSYNLIKLNNSIDPQILKIVLITGYPNACKPVNNEINVFGDESYFYEREVIFSNGGVFNIKVECERRENKLISLFTINGKCDNVSIVNSEPIIECWTPLKNGKLSGQFRLCWKTKKGNYLFGDASSVYSPKNKVTNLPIYHRYIEIASKVDKKNKKLSLLQTSKLFNKL